MARRSSRTAAKAAPEAAPAADPTPETPAPAKRAAAKDHRIKTVSEFARLSPDEQAAFRLAEGTVTPDPIAID